MKCLSFASMMSAGLLVAFSSSAAQAQVGYGYPGFAPQTPVVRYPAAQPAHLGGGYQTTVPCATGQCPMPASGYGAYQGSQPCLTGNCPTPSSCQTICGPNGCQTICQPSGGLNGYRPLNNPYPTNYPANYPSNYQSNYPANFSHAPANTGRPFTSLDLDLAPQWAAPAATAQPAFGNFENASRRGGFPSSADSNFSNDANVRLY